MSLTHSKSLHLKDIF